MAWGPWDPGAAAVRRGPGLGRGTVPRQRRLPHFTYNGSFSRRSRLPRTWGLAHRPRRDPEALEDTGDGAVCGEGGDGLIDLRPHELAVGQRDASDADPGLAHHRRLDDVELRELRPLPAERPPRRLPNDQGAHAAVQQHPERLLGGTDRRALPALARRPAVVEGDEPDVAHRALDDADANVARHVLEALPRGFRGQHDEAPLVVG